ncbi:MAG: triose-phosphate isomerase [Candidatus Omnitrophica bacterium]|nr:triose-phosphate isomerase [Candidatus Omnitrophota bacterium]MCM8793277.1 triose-phosphate isomerase [Candidatus Omnitrophota bacterium]
MRKPIIAGNWKMHKTVREAIELVNGLKRNFFDEMEIDIVVCPPYTALSEVGEIIQDSQIRLGAQDMHWEERGAFTGEISPLMLKDLGVEYVIIGHSERRQFFGETNETVNKKVKSALKHKLIPIVCVGETLVERERGDTFSVVREHIENALVGVVIEKPRDLVVAYEPVWAIGTGVNATPEQAEEVQGYIRELLMNLFGEEIAEGIRIQYGGSVRPDNIEELINEKNIDGALVGGASLDLNSFTEIIRRVETAIRKH